MGKETEAEYRCTQQELYSVSDTLYVNLKNHLPEFVVYKSKYDEDFVAALQDRRTTAMNLPDEESRSSTAETFHSQMLPFANASLRNFQLLKGYIKDAFTEEHHDIQFKVAGQNKYTSSARGDWKELSGMNLAMTTYITANLQVLIDKGYMPAAFADTVQEASDGFGVNYSAFKVARQTGAATTEKLKANNLLYKDMMTICDEGQRLFAQEAEKKKLFVFNAIKLIVSPPGSASFKLTLKKQEENTPVSGARVCIQADGAQAIELFTDADGIALFEHINPAVYKMKIEVAGMEPVNFVKEVNTGTASKKEVFV